MSYDGKIMRQALARFEEDKQRRAAEFARRRDRLYETEPRLKEIEQQLRATMPKLIASALRRGADPLPAVRVLQDENLDLQRQRMQLLTGMGYPADYLEEKPACPLCGDTGYHDGQVCRCLREYYKRAQLSELSRMLDLGNQSFETFSFDWYSDERGERKRSPRENMERVFDICQDYARHFSLAADNLLLTGQSGLGKTSSPPALRGWSATGASAWCTTRRSTSSPRWRRRSSAPMIPPPPARMCGGIRTAIC